MNADERRYINSLTEQVLSAAFEVSNTLGVGFLEKVYQRALWRELGRRGIKSRMEAGLTVFYKGEDVGNYVADLLVEDILILELKCADSLAPEHTAQCLNYLRASNRNVCLLMNFQRPTMEWKRVVREF